MNDQKPKWKYRTALLFLAVVAVLCAGPLLARAAETRLPAKPSSGGAVTSNDVENGSRTAASPKIKEHGLPQKAVEIARVFGFPITNSMVVTWIVALGLIVFAQVATRDMKQVPDGAQNLLEWLVEGLYGFLEGIIGPHLVKRTFWFFATIFIFILAANWVGLIPGVGTIGWGHQTAARLRDRSAAVPRGQRRSQPDAGHGAGLLRLLDRLGAAGSRPARVPEGTVRAQGRERRR